VAAEESVVPAGLCRTLPRVEDQAALLTVLQGAPDFFENTGKNSYRLKVDLREIPRAVAFDLLDKTAAKNWGAVEFVSDPGFRGECGFFIREATLRAIDETFVLELAMPLSGQTDERKPFWMKAMILGRSQVALVFAQSQVTYHNGRSKRNFSFSRSVRMNVRTMTEGGALVRYLNGIQNLSVQTGFPFGWETVERIRLRGGTFSSWVLGKWRKGSDIIPVSRKAQDPMRSLLVKPFADGIPRSRQALMRRSASLDMLRRVSHNPGLFR